MKPSVIMPTIYLALLLNKNKYWGNLYVVSPGSLMNASVIDIRFVQQVTRDDVATRGNK
jgi:hypothetical protein